MISPERALRSDLAAIRQLLAGCGLPHQDLTADQLRSFWVLRGQPLVHENGRPGPEPAPPQLVGVIGVEPYGQEGLLRSLALLPARRGQNLGKLLVGHLEVCARQAGIERLFLLTTTAADFFRRLGYEETARMAATEKVQGSAEFQSLCPSTAACLSKRL